jgi:type IV pilus assembly protein PilY1
VISRQNLFSCLLAALLIAAPVEADDTDIYLDSGLGGGVQGPPLIMMTLDLRSNLGSSECSAVLAACSSGTCSCEEKLGTELFQALDLVDASGSPGGDGVADFSQHSAAALGADGLGSSSAYWDGLRVTMFDGMRAVFAVLLSGLTEVQVGMMINHEDSCNGNPDAGPTKIPGTSSPGCSNGAYILKGFFDPADTSELSGLLEQLAALPVPSSTVNGTTWNGHPYQIREMYLEYYRYITGGDMFNGWLGYDSFNSELPRKNLMEGGNDVSGVLAPDPDTYTGSGATATYVSPFSSGDTSDWACSRLFMVNTMDAVSNSAADSDFAISAAAPAGLGISSPTDANVVAKMNDLDLAGSGLGLNIEGDQTLTSYWVADNVNTTTNNYATAGGTGIAYDHGEPSEALESLRSIFREILSVSTTFVAASVPVNVFNRAEVVDNVFLAIFEAQQAPLWPGNVKKLKIAQALTADGEETGQLVIQDADGDAAFSSDDGRIKSDALTYWSDPYGEDVLAFDPALGEVSGKDGRAVARGGAGQRIPGMLDDVAPGTHNSDAGARQLFTETPGSPNTLMAYNADAATATALAPYLDPGSIYSNNELQKIIGWGRGIDEFDDDGDSGDDSRDWMLGDPMHSRPLVVNYGAVGGYSVDNTLIRLFFGSNDGWFHTVENTQAGGSQSGEEKFGFLPLEVMHKQQVLVDNNPTLVDSHPYGIDGEAVAYTYDADSDGNIESGDKVWIYVGMRRGGKAYYAFDASNPAVAPTMKWKIEKSGDFAELGMTFSTPRVTTLKYNGDLVPVLIFAGGYHGGWSGSSRLGKDQSWDDSTEGNAVYIVNADTGALIWKAVEGTGFATNTVYKNPGLVDSIPSAVSLLDSDGNGITDRAYVGDSGGSVWRINLPEGSTAGHRAANWKMTKLADFGADNTANDRRFFHAPDVVKTKDSGGEYHGVVIASGDRAHPSRTSVNNYLYLVKDRSVSSATVSPLLVDETDASVLNDLPNITNTCIAGDESTCLATDLSKGWKLTFEGNGEKGLSTPLTSDGIVFFTSYLPEGTSSSSNCAPSEGDGRLYAVRLRDGSIAYELNNVIEGTDKADRFTTVGPGIPPGAKPLGDHILLPGTGIDGNQIIKTGGRSRWRIYWRDIGVDRLESS